MDFQRYSTGTWISGIGHAGLILWLVVGWGLNGDPMDFQVTQVSVVSGEDYAAMVAATSPTTTTDPLPEMISPEVADTPPAPIVEETPPAAVTPEPAPEAPVEETPPPAPPARPEPVETPAETVSEPALPETPAGAEDLPQSDHPVERPADRIASTPTAPPPPDADTALEPQTEIVEDAPNQSPDPVVEEQTPAAPEETATRIVTADETPSAAPTTSPRPPSRPSNLARPAPAPEPQVADAAPTPAAPERDEAADAIAAALAEASSSSAAANEGPATAGPPLTGGEEDGFRRAVSQCWVVDSGAQWANVTVTVGFSLAPDGKVTGDVRMINYSGGDDALARTAFETARRAILRCQSSGYPLPPEKYEHWKEVELTFDPSTMRLR